MGKATIDRAGMIPYHIADDGTINMVFQIPSNPKYGGTDPQLCKGKVDPGETAIEAAIREAKEELGLFVPNVVGEPIYLGKFLGRTDVFMCQIKDPKLFGIPTTPDEVQTVLWLTPDEFMTQGRQLHKHVVRAATRAIQKQTTK